MGELADAVLRQCAEGGHESVSVDRIASQLSVSRSTLYRTVPSREHLLGIALEHRTRDLAAQAEDILSRTTGAREQLDALVRLQVEAAVATRGYLFVFFASGVLPESMQREWRRWARDYEDLWRGVVAQAMDAGELARDDPAVTTRLLLGMCIWVSRWYRPEQGLSPDDIARSVLHVVAGSTASTP